MSVLSVPVIAHESQLAVEVAMDPECGRTKRRRAASGHSIQDTASVRAWRRLRLSVFKRRCCASASSPDAGESSLGAGDFVLNCPAADADGANNGPINLHRKAAALGRDPRTLLDST